MPLARPLPPLPFQRPWWRGLPSSRCGQGGPWSTPTQHPQLRVTFVRLPLRARPLSPAPTPLDLTDSYPRSMCSINEERPAEAARARGGKGERERRQLTRRCAGMGNAKYTSVPSRSLRPLPRSLPFAIPLSSSPSSSILRSVHVSRHISPSLSLVLFLSPAPRHPHPRDTGPRRAREGSPRDKFALFAVPFSLAESSRPAKVADVRRRLHLHCHYESAHVARGMSFLLRAPVWLYRLRTCAYARVEKVGGRGSGNGGG